MFIIKKGYGFFIKSVTLLFIITSPALTKAEEVNQYKESLIETALSKKLYEKRYWEILLHYKGDSPKTSLVDDPKFFNAPEGKTNPRAELTATIDSFFNEITDDKQHPLCRFLARYHWLKEELDIDENKLPRIDCTEFKEIIVKTEPKSAALVFPTAHMNNPASMFGHTLIRVDTKYESKLLSLAINYSALTRENSGFLFAIRGLFGFYTGGYTVQPYYDKVSEYNDISFRDIWEYELNFTKKEIMRMLRHAWELHYVYSYYYFFDENCSFNLMFLMEAARPELNFTDDIGGDGFWVVPMDTVRKVFDNEAVAKSTFRPSKATKVNHIANLLSDEEKSVAHEITKNKLDPKTVLEMDLDRTTKIRLLDTAIEYIQAQYFDEKLSPAKYRKLFIATLRVRKDLGIAKKTSYDIAVPSNPIDGHKSARVAKGVGIRRDSEYFELRYRAAYHDILDHDDGYRRGSAIEFASGAVRFYADTSQWKLEELKFVDIFALSPRGKFFKPQSWRTNLGLKQSTLRDEEEHLVFNLNIARGVTYKTGFLSTTSFLLESEVLVSGAYEYNHTGGLGASIIFVSPIGQDFKIFMQGKGIHNMLGDTHDLAFFKFGGLYRVSKDKSIKINITRDKTFGRYKTDSSIEWNIYF